MTIDIENKKVDNNFPWSVLVSTIEMTSKTQTSFTAKFSLNILTSFLGSIRVRYMENHYLSICFYN